ncbi:MAG: hypothetical protein LC803_22125 [Acidobacteria bacterium]|nr:hypothetical protein [Acidobacteriota bacterium]
MPQADNASNDLKHMNGVDMERPLISPAEPSSGSQDAVPPSPAVGEPERLLDINGLLEIVKILNNIRKDE